MSAETRSRAWQAEHWIHVCLRRTWNERIRPNGSRVIAVSETLPHYSSAGLLREWRNRHKQYGRTTPESDPQCRQEVAYDLFIFLLDNIYFVIIPGLICVTWLTFDCTVFTRKLSTSCKNVRACCASWLALESWRWNVIIVLSAI